MNDAAKDLDQKSMRRAFDAAQAAGMSTEMLNGEKKKFDSMLARAKKQREQVITLIAHESH